MKNILPPLVIIVVFLSISYVIGNRMKQRIPSPDNFTGIRYVALGDSYTIGEGVSSKESWPNLLTAHLQQEGIAIKLIANPSVTGWTTQQVIDHELPVFERSDPTFATLLIGVNDWVQGVPPEVFQARLRTILDRMQSILPDKQNIVLITIPDFSATPTGQNYGDGRDIAQGIAVFNDIIKDEGEKRSLPVADIFPLSQQMKGDPNSVAADGLHPSAKAYAQWEQIIYPAAYSLLE